MIAQARRTLAKAICRILYQFAGAALAFVPAAADAASPPTHGRGFSVQESGYYGEDSHDPAVAWIDDLRVLFSSIGPVSHAGVLDREKEKSLYVWNTASGVVEKFASLHESASGFCYAAGKLRYWYTSNGNTVQRVGHFGSELEYVHDHDQKQRLQLNRLTCDYYMDRDMPSRNGMYFRPLREGEGYLGLSVDVRKNATVYLPTAKSEYIALPIPERTAAIGYSEFLKRYVLKETPVMVSRHEAMSMRFWLFDPAQAKVEQIIIPAGPWLKGSIAFVAPARNGVVFSSHATGRPGQDGRPTTGAGGLYVVLDRKATRFLPGYPYSTAVSPNGCKVAVSLVSRFAAAELPTVKFADLCAKER